MYIGLHMTYPIFLSDSNQNGIVSTDFRKIIKYEITWKSIQWEPSSLMQTDMTKLKIAFRNSAKSAYKHERWLTFSHRELENISKEKFVDDFESNYIEFSWKISGEYTKISQDIPLPGWDSKPGPCEYAAWMVTTLTALRSLVLPLWLSCCSSCHSKAPTW
jgi:hypothetical protein